MDDNTESVRRQEEFDRWLRRDLLRFYGSAFLFAVIVVALKIVLDIWG